MVEILNYNVYDLKESIIASGNAMRTEPVKYTDEEFEKGLERCKKLSKFGGGTGHSNYRTGIRVSFDIKYPLYWTKEAQRYHFFDIVTSSSTMHKLMEMDIYESCNKYVTIETKYRISKMINERKELIKKFDQCESIAQEQIIIDGYSYKYNLNNIKTKEDVLYDSFMRIVSNCPQGIELFMRCSTNYEQLATIYKQRRHHKLKEDWGTFCDWIETLPYAKGLIIC